MIRLVAALVLFTLASGTHAARVEIPLRVPLDAIRQALAARLAASPERPNEIYREGRCRYLNLAAPALEGRDGVLRLSGPGDAAFGVELFGACQKAVAWQGTMEFRLVPRIDRAGHLRVRIVDSKLTDASGAKAAAVIWDQTKRYVHPRLERFSYDLGASRDALLGILRASAPAAQGSAMEQVISGLRVLEPRIESKQVIVPISLELPDAWLAPPAQAATSAAPLSEAEVEALELALQPWDAFLVYSIRQVAIDNERLRQRLFTLLLESRYQLVALLSGDEPAGSDPLRTLFIDTWNELRSILADSEYTLFVDAGDAFAALQEAAPGLDMRLTPDGLRQLARSLRPGDTADPLAYDLAVDPQLQSLFKIEETQDPAPPPAPPAGRSRLDFFISRAYAQEPLDRWVPSAEELPDYQARIRELLSKTTIAELEHTPLGAPYDKIYRSLVPATALIESCWHQYVRRGGKVTYLRSQSSSIGIMQINQHVWRGFYDIQRLRWDTAYNTRAGAQILMRYVKDYAIPYAEKTGDPDHVPRAAYAVYNAGPRGVGRFNKAKRHPREERVDERLRTLYQGIAAGGQADLSSCSVVMK
ncbi:MAG TPA: lytic transglycosylase domain-containing protein [Burkholderiales bacterium]